MFGHRRRQAESSLSVRRVRNGMAAARHGMVPQSSDASHGAAARTKRRIFSSSSASGSSPRAEGSHFVDEIELRNRVNRPPASLIKARQNFDRRNRANAPKR